MSRLDKYATEEADELLSEGEAKSDADEEKEEETGQVLLQDRIFSFVDSYRLRMNKWVYVLYQLWVIVQILALIRPERYYWGPKLGMVNYINYFVSTLGLNAVPYVGIPYIIIIILSIYACSLVLFVISYYFYIKGNLLFDKIKRVVQAVIVINCIAPYAFLSIMNNLWMCDNTTGILVKFPDFQCYTQPNIIWAVLALVLAVIQIVLYAFGQYCIVDTNPRHSVNMIFFPIYCNTSLMLVVTLVVLTSAVTWIHPLFLLAQGISTTIIVFRVVPFYHKSVNAIYAGLAMARIPYSITTLILQIVNTSNDDTLGSIIGGVAIASYGVCFVIGFTAMQIYIFYIRWRVRKYDNILASGENLNKINLWYLDIVLRLASNTPKLRAEVEKTVKFAALNNLESLDLTLTRAVHNIYLPGGSLMLASHLLQKVSTFRPNFLYKFTLYLRYRDLEINIGETNNKKRIYALLNNAHDVQKELQLYVTLFFKIIVSGNMDMSQLSTFAHRSYRAEKECTRIMESLLTQYPKDIAVVRNYARFIEEVKRDPELAREYYEEASSLEDQEQERATQKRKVFLKLENEDKDTSTEGSEKRGDNAVIPLHSSQALDIDEDDNQELERYKAKRESRRAKSPSVIGGSVIGSQTNSFRKQDVYRKKLLNKDNKWGLRLIVSSFGAGLVLCGIIVIIVSQTSLTFVPPQLLVNSCEVPAHPYQSLVILRQYQYQQANGVVGNDSINVVSALSPILKIDQGITDNVLSTKMSAQRQEMYMGKRINIEIPVIDVVNKNYTSVGLNRSVYDASILFQTNLRSLVNGDVLANATVTSNPFLYFWLNRATLANEFFSYCQAFRQDFLGATESMFSIVGVLAALVIVWHLVLFSVCLFSIVVFFKSQYNILSLFTLLPREVVGRTYQFLRRIEKSEDKVRIENKMSIRTKTFLIGGLIVLLDLLVIAVIIAEDYYAINCGTTTSYTITAYGKVQFLAQRVTFNVGEMINTPTDLVFPYKDPTVAYKFLSELTDSLRVAWDELRFGNSFARGYMGWTPSIDQMFLSTTCGPNVTTTSVQCLSLNGLVDDIVISAEKNIREKVGMSSSEKYAAVRRSYLASQLLSEKLSNTTSNFLSVSTGNCGLGFPTLALYIPVFFVMLILSVLLFNEMDTYLNINQQIRSMLLLIPPDASEAVPDIREYVNTLSTKMSILSFLSKNNKDNDKKTKAILEGSTDGVILCNSEGNIVEVNSAAQAMFSITQADVVGNNLSTLFSEDVTMLIREVSKTHKGTKKELHGKRKEDAQFPVRLSTSVGVWNNKTHVACFVTDCTIEQKQKELLDIEKKNNETLLLSILPSAVASRLKRGETCIADQLEDVTCFFSDMVGFTKMSSTMTATDLVTILNKIVVGLDDLCVANNLEKIKTIGDAYFCVGGLGNDPYHPEHTVRFGLQAIKCVRELSEGEISIRVGVHTGPVVAGVIGRNKFAYDCWGDSVNMASRMESTGIPNRVQISRQTYERVHDIFKFEERHGIEVKGKGTVTTYIVINNDVESEKVPAVSVTAAPKEIKGNHATPLTPLTVAPSKIDLDDFSSPPVPQVSFEEQAQD